MEEVEMADNNERERFGANVGPSELDRLSEELSGPVRRTRQDAAHTLAQIAKEDPARLEAAAATIVPALVDALYRPEAQTRWEALDALCELAAPCTELVAEAFDGAEAALFDEGSARVRIAAFRLLARLGACSAELSDKAWPLLEEAVQCFHGDPGYRDMLAALLEFARGGASAASKEALAERVSFDAESGRGYVKSLSEDIIKAAKGE